MQEESEYLGKLKREIEGQKIQDKEKKKRKGEEAARILEANAEADARREARRQEEQREDVRLAELKKQQDEAEDARRQAEWDARAAKIAKSMAYMADTVGKQQEEQERINAEKLRRTVEERRRLDDENDQARKRALEQRLADMRKGLSY